MQQCLPFTVRQVITWMNSEERHDICRLLPVNRPRNFYATNSVYLDCFDNLPRNNLPARNMPFDLLTFFVLFFCKRAAEVAGGRPVIVANTGVVQRANWRERSLRSPIKPPSNVFHRATHHMDELWRAAWFCRLEVTNRLRELKKKRCPLTCWPFLFCFSAKGQLKQHVA